MSVTIADLRAPDDVLTMPRDPRWQRHANGSLIHVQRPGGAELVIPAGADQELRRAQTDWYQTAYASLRALKQLEQALKALPKQKRRPTAQLQMDLGL